MINNVNEITDYNRWTKFTDTNKNKRSDDFTPYVRPAGMKSYDELKNVDYNATPPKKTLTALKLFSLKNGRLIGPKEEDTGHSYELGRWYTAEDKSFTNANGKKRFALYNPDDNKKSGDATNRPGFHAILDIPSAMQLAVALDNTENGIGAKKTGMRNSFVWAIVELADETGEWYQQESINNAFIDSKKFDKNKQKIEYPPYGGTYIPLAQNPSAKILWVVAGHMKVVRLLKDDEVEQMIMAYEKERGQSYADYRMHRKQSFDKEKFEKEVDAYNSTDHQIEKNENVLKIKSLIERIEK